MALMDDILSQLQGLGFGGSFSSPLTFGDISGIIPAEIQQAMQSSFDLSPGDLSPGMFQPIGQGLLSGALGKTYSPFLQATSQNLVGDLIQKMSGKTGKQAGGGFAGSGQFQRFTSGAKDVYGKGMAGALVGTQEKQTKSLQNIQDIINAWREAAGGIAG